MPAFPHCVSNFSGSFLVESRSQLRAAFCIQNTLFLFSQSHSKFVMLTEKFSCPSQKPSSCCTSATPLFSGGLSLLCSRRNARRLAPELNWRSESVAFSVVSADLPLVFDCQKKQEHERDGKIRPEYGGRNDARHLSAVDVYGLVVADARG